MSDAIHTLVVDDSEFFAEMTADTLASDHGMSTQACNSVAEAKEVLQDERVDCIVSDYEMPGEDGIEFLRWVRDQYDGLPFILLTGRGDEEVASEAIAAGVADYLLKLEVVEDKQYERLANRIRSVVDQHRTKHKYRQLVENSPDGIAHVSADGDILAINGAMASVCPGDRETLLGASLPEVLGEVGRQRLAAGRRAIDAGETVTTEDAVDGRQFHNIFVPLDALTNQESFQLLSRDITERTSREQQLRRQNDRLETFASVVAHDLRNPLNVAASSLTQLDEAVGDRDAYDRIERSLDRMDALIDDVLALARQGETVTDRQALDLETVVREAWTTVETDDATLSVDGSTTVRADPGRLQQLLENLFRNAVEHAGPEVTITVGATDDGFFLADDGPGVAADAHEEVFELGYSTSQGGTGMGLAIVAEIVDAHGWEITLTDSPDGGARFDVLTDSGSRED